MDKSKNKNSDCFVNERKLKNLIDRIRTRWIKIPQYNSQRIKNAIKLKKKIRLNIETFLNKNVYACAACCLMS